jgi:hypothetical protein
MSPQLNNVNWDEIAKGEILPEGKYAARIDKVEEKVSKPPKNNPYWQVTFTLTEEPHTGRKAWDKFMLSTDALWKLKNLLDAIGLEVKGEADLDSNDLLQQEVGIVIKHETYEGQLRHRVQGFFNLTK